MEKKGPKILIFIIILALLGGAIYLIVNKDGKTNNKEKMETVNSIKYFLYLGEGYDSKYNGVDRFFNIDSFTKEDLNNGLMLTAAYRYAMDPNNDIDTTITPVEYAAVEEGTNIEGAKVIKGKIIRDAIKALFGIDYDNSGYTNKGYKYSYYYDSVTDMFIRKETTNTADENYSVLPIVVSNSKKGDTITSEVAVAYIVKNDKKFDVYADKDNMELIKSAEEINISDFTEEDYEKMAKFTVTCKDVEKNYVFEKMEAVK